jgi:hypothetical protein
MKTQATWNTQPKTDTVAFSALIATAMFLAWLAAAAPVAAPNPVLGTAAAPAAVPTAHQAGDSSIAVSARQLARSNG